MPMAGDAPFQSTAYGVFTADLSSAAIFNDRFPEQAMVLDNGQAHSELLELLDQWDALGHPTLHQLRIHALSEPPGSISEGDWKIPKRSDYTWILSWNV